MCTHAFHDTYAMTALSRSALHFAAAFFLLLLPTTHAAFITFDDCLPDRTKDSSPKLLQFTPYFVDAYFGENQPHSLNLTIYGNVSGRQFDSELPPASNTAYWNNVDEENGKIVDVGNANKYATLTADYQILTYTAYNNRGEQFCRTLVNGTCPLGPAFRANASNPYDLPAFFVSHDFGSSYSFSTISTTVHVISGDTGGSDVACVSVQITPDLGPSIAGLLTWLPAAILIMKGIATLSAAIWSPWGSSDIFRWSSNYGRDEDLLRLVTPGFGDCLQYIQFVVLTGSLTLQYPGFFQPAVSQTSWSVLLFNDSYVSGGNGTQSLVDGLYSTNATYGLTRMSQLIGMSEGQDIWACMAIWLLVIAGIVVLLCQAGFLGRWIFHVATKTTEEDLRKKNLPFTLGNIVRLLFNFFILPIVALSLFQLVIAPRSSTAVVACAAVLLLIMIVWAGWILRIIFGTKPRTLLFDDMPTVLLYGPLYNTYSDSAAPFALVPVFITFMRGVAIGAVQPSGIGQIIVLAICEVILILTLNGFRPFQGQTSMNLYHTFFASVRLVTVLLMIAFVPTLGVTEAPKGWIGYIILLLHACVLIFGFFLNSAQTIVEVVARAFGAGGDSSGAVRGSILNWRMLKKRQDRGTADRGSMMSSAAILKNADTRSQGYGTRSRSISASSQQLLNRMSGFENFSQGGEAVSSPGDELEQTATFGSAGVANGRTSLAKGEGDAFYRPPRPRKTTMETLANPGAKTRSTADFPYTDSPHGPAGHHRDTSYDSGAFHGSPAPAYLRDRQGSGDETGPRTDYAVREVDQYYRGPPLKEQQNRKLKTGPADPEGPASAATSWLQTFFTGFAGKKKKDQSKGFEVVRSARMPPGMQQNPAADDVEMQTSPAMHQEPYRDAPDTPRNDEGFAKSSVERSISPTDNIAQQPPTNNFEFGFDDTPGSARDILRASRITNVRPDSDALGAPGLEPISYEHADSMGVSATPERRPSQATTASRYPRRRSKESEVVHGDTSRYSDQPIPALAAIEPVGSLDIPSRFPSNASGFNNNPFAQGERDQSWLRAVDQLSWGNHSRQASTRSSQPAAGLSHQASNASGQALRSPPPSVPQRNSRRTLSQEVAASRYQPHTETLFEGFDSTPDLSLSPVQSPGSPSHQQVSHHRAGDSISRNSFGAAAALRETSGNVEYGTTPSRSGSFFDDDERL
ncbi:hypothetical protein AC578_1519 [Pseudocercospora eumusae]|uniref:ML-like domain-containing protein n=1 Tax=Pseudocercospora eumusae TaxID=321146 RepID=A0A139GXU2_9PEZI|nr:hypothetical protein AC578_1519 [Pseudocercospora eumusae]